jgi:tetratricopeptide (TPR) repeat protein
MHVLLGGCFLAESDYRNALSEYKEALDIEPENAAALSGAASANEKLGMKENSLETMQLLKKLKPDDPGVARQYAHVLLSANRPDAAFSLITGVLDKMPKDLQTLNLLGQYYICREDDRKAEETYSRIESIDPSYADCYRDAAERFAQLGYLKKAEKYIREFLERKPEDPSGLLVLAVLYEAEKMISEALVQYHKVLKYDRYNSIALDAVRRLGDVMNAEAEKQPPVEDVNRDFDDNTPEIPMGIDDRQFEDQKNTTEGKSSGKQDEDFDFDMWNGETTVASAIDEPLDLPEDSEPPEQPEESGNTLDDLVEGDNPIDFSPAPPEQPDPFDSAAAPSDDDTEPEEDLPDMPDESAQDSVSPLPEDEDKENVPEKPEESGSESADKEIPPEALKELKDAQDRVAAETRKATAAADQAVRAAEDAADTARGLKHKADSIAEDVARDAAEKIQNAARDAADTASELARQQAEDMLRRAKSMLDEALNKNKEQEETSETPEPVQEVETPVSVPEPQKVYEYVPPEIPEQEENKDAESENGKQPVMKDTYDTFEETARMLPAIVNMLMNTENADRYPELLELFKKLHTLSEYLPPEKRQQFLSGKDRIQLDYVISKLEGKPGLLATAQALRKAARLDSEHSLETYETIELSGDELVRNVLDLMTDLSSSLEDPTLITALGGIADDVRRRLDTGNGI